MRQYELALVITPDLSEDKVKIVGGKVEELIKAEKGKITKKDFWAKRTLAYPIAKNREAQFVFMNFETSQVSIAFSQKIRLTENILRFLLLKK